MSVLQLPAELLHANAVAQSATLLDALRRQTDTRWQLDASSLREFDSSALSVLLELQRQAAQAGQKLEITGATPKLKELAGLYGIAELLVAQAA
jgi:phospholipid transport system transporter-binding protein